MLTTLACSELRQQSQPEHQDALVYAAVLDSVAPRGTLVVVDFTSKWGAPGGRTALPTEVLGSWR